MARLDMIAAPETGPGTSIDETLFQMGISSSTGKDGEPDLIAAHKWFNLAAMQGNDAAAAYRQEVASEMSPADIAKAQREAREWVRTH